KDYYSVEIKIAFEIFGRTPKNKETWIGNICRNIYTSGDMRSCSSWAHVEDGFHEPDSFGHIIFKDKSLSIKKAKRVENNLLLSVKKVVKEEIKEEIKKILESFSSCQHELSEGTKTPSLKKDAAAVLKSYEDIKAQFPSIKTLSMKEVKLLFEKSQELSQDVDRLKEKILLESFF
ncbi:hypothetical protein KAW55_06715, partial [bacterium]|nr:hypothetical protein [bacterium]